MLVSLAIAASLSFRLDTRTYVHPDPLSIAQNADATLRRLLLVAESRNSLGRCHLYRLAKYQRTGRAGFIHETHLCLRITCRGVAWTC